MKIYIDTTGELVIDNGTYENRYPASSGLERDKGIVNESLIIRVIDTQEAVMAETPFGELEDSGGTPYVSFASLKSAIDPYFESSVSGGVIGYSNIAALIANQEDQITGGIYRVVDATGDATVDLGYAYYEYLGTTLGTIADYRKLSEEESMDLDVILANGSVPMSGALNEKKLTVASSATPNLSGANDFDITGVIGITGFTAAVQAGVARTTTFLGTPTLTHNATDFILPTGANIITAVGDSAIWRSLDNTGKWKCVSYTRASGEALVGGSGGGENVYYRRTGFIDVVSVSWWHMLDLPNAYRTEWDLNTNVSKGNSPAAISDATLDLTTAFGWAYANQTIVSLKVIGRDNQANITHIGIIKVTWNSGHTATIAKTLLYETDSISFTNNAFNVLAASFTNTDISENDDIYVFFASDSIDDRYLHVELKCSID